VLKLFNYFIPLIAFSGLIFGVILAKIPHEEVRDGLNYFRGFEKVIIFLIVMVLFYSIDRTFNSFTILIVGCVFGYLGGKFSKDYFYFGLISSISFIFVKEVFFVLNVLIFLYGLPRGSLMRKFRFGELYKNFLLFIVPFLVLVYFLKMLEGNLVSLLIGISSGGLLRFLVKRSFII
jgi:hypothetical protein